LDAEAKFQSDFIKIANAYGWSAYHLSGDSGLPDILMFKGLSSHIVELKAIPTSKLSQSIKSMFQSSQMPFYLRQVQMSGTPTVIAIKWIMETQVYSYWSLDNTKDIIDFFAMKAKDVFMNSKTFSSLEFVFDHAFGDTV
jgi:hypothetical protein